MSFHNPKQDEWASPSDPFGKVPRAKQTPPEPKEQDDE